ncbi:MAG: hypothetical protein ACXWJW_00165 [Xanthobacteraceae bacterium]
MRKLDQPFLKDMLQRLEDGERYALSPDRFAEIFPPGHQYESAMADARSFAAVNRCIVDYWLATNEVFFTKQRRSIPQTR